MNIDELLTPISESAPCGDDLSFSHEFDEITEFRREDDPTLKQGEWVTALKTADWAAVRGRCSELLARRSKDLRLSMWWTEASTLLDGYAGLQQGLLLCHRLCESHWDGLHPQAESGDLDQRIGNIGWLLSRLVTLSTAVPVTSGRSGRFTLLQIQSVKAQAAASRPAERPIDANGEALTLDKVSRALRDTPKEDLRQNLAALESAQAALNAWQAAIDTRLGNDGPSFRPAREALAAAHHELHRWAREAGALAGTAGDVAPGGGDAAASMGAALTRALGGPLRSREQALAQLREVAAYFRTTEPHSPVAYLADKAVRWGDMPLHVWLRSVVKDAGSLSHLEEMLGVQPVAREGDAA